MAQDLSSPVTSASDSSSLKKHLTEIPVFVFKQAQFACLCLSCFEPFHLFLFLLVVLYL